MRNVYTPAMALLAVGFAACGGKEHVDQSVPQTECVVKITSVKDQGESSLCWAYAMLAMIESDRIMQGDSVNLSPLYVAYSSLASQAEAYYLTQGSTRITTRGMSPYALRLILSQGLTHYDAYNNAGTNFRVVCRKLCAVLTDAVNRRTGMERAGKAAAGILDNGLRPKPKRVYMYGVEYTPVQFAHSVCRPGEYVCLTSFTHKPFGETITLDVPDNYSGETFVNVPLDTLQARIDRALRGGRAVCWEGDSSEPGFSFDEGYARLADDRDSVTQEARQKDFETFRTTDDHCMEIIGIAHGGDSTKYYICKNSWGTGNPFGGLMYMSESYLRKKTIAVVMRE